MRSTRVPSAGLVLALGGLATALLGTLRKDLPEVELAIGVTFLLAWVVERGSRFGGSGATLTGLGIGLVLAEYVAGYAGYREELAFGGIGAGLLLATRMASGALRGAGLGLMAVALSEAALQRLPARITAPGLFRAFNEGWAFGLMVAIYGLAIIMTASRRRPSQQG